MNTVPKGLSILVRGYFSDFLLSLSPIYLQELTVEHFKTLLLLFLYDYSPPPDKLLNSYSGCQVQPKSPLLRTALPSSPSSHRISTTWDTLGSRLGLSPLPEQTLLSRKVI